MTGNNNQLLDRRYGPGTLIALIALFLALSIASAAIAGAPTGSAAGISSASSSQARLLGSGYWDPGFEDLLDGEVDAIAISGTEVYLGGWFGYAGGVSASRIAGWDGSSWFPLGSGLWGYQLYYFASAVAISGTEVYVGGVFSSAGGVNANYIARWDGSAWSSLGSTAGGPVRALAVGSDGLYVGGLFSDAWGVGANNIARWDGSAWSALGSGTDGPVYSIAISGTEVYVGGHFSVAGGVSANNTARWDGSSWSSVGSGVSGGSYASVDALAISDNTLYAGGVFTSAGGMDANYIAKWNGSSWSPLNIGVSGDMYTRVSAIDMLGSDVYVGGRFNTAGGVSANHIARWNGSSWSPLGSGLDGPARAIKVRGNDVYVGGNFINAGGQPSGRFGVWHAGAGPTPTLTATFTPTISLSPSATSTAALASPTSTVTVTATATATPTTCPIEFTDVPSSHTFYPAVRCLACRYIVSGYTDGTFHPEYDVTRGQLAKIVSNSAGFAEPHTDQTFQDIPLNHTFYIFVERLAARDILRGYPCGGVGEPCPGTYFRPNNTATRGQIAKIVCEARECADPPTSQTFEDVPPSHTFYTDIERLFTLGTINGYPCGNPELCVPPLNRPYFRPANNVSRGQTAKIVANTFYPNCYTPSER